MPQVQIFPTNTLPPGQPSLNQKDTVHSYPKGYTMFKGLTRSLTIIMGMIVAVPYLIILAVE